jgi:FkbM family methyltransferase
MKTVALLKRSLFRPVRPLVRRARLRLRQLRARPQPGPPAALRCTVSYNRYGGYCVPHASRHRVAARQILARRIYEPETIEFMRDHCGAGDVVHAGTYFGDFLPALSDACAPGARIWAFEPNRENYRCAAITLSLNDIQNVTLVHAGLGARQDSAQIQVRDGAGLALGGASAIVAGSRIQAGFEPARLVPLDQMIGADRMVSIIQLDVEGYEQEALTGALGIIARHHPILLLEVARVTTLISSEWFARHILAIGYRQIRRLHQNVVFARTPA